jgi:hypothetical protein
MTAATATASTDRRPPRARLHFSPVLAVIMSSSCMRTFVRNRRSHVRHTCDRRVTCDLRFCALGEGILAGRPLPGRLWCHACDQEKQ